MTVSLSNSFSPPLRPCPLPVLVTDSNMVNVSKVLGNGSDRTMRGCKASLITKERMEGRAIVSTEKAFCYAHGGFVPVAMLEADHMQPKASVGTEVNIQGFPDPVFVTVDGVEDMANKWPMCRKCNGDKSAKDPIDRLRKNPDFGPRFLETIAAHPREGITAALQERRLTAMCKVLCMGKLWDIDPEGSVGNKLKLNYKDEIPLIIEGYDVHSLCFSPAITPDQLSVVAEQASLKSLKNRGVRIEKLEISGDYFDVVRSDFSNPERDIITIRISGKNVDVIFNRKKDEITIYGAVQESAEIKVHYKITGSLKEYLSNFTDQSQFKIIHEKDPNNPWDAVARKPSENSDLVIVKGVTSNGIAFHFDFDQPTKTLALTPLRIENQDQSLIVVHPLSSPLTYCRNPEDGVLCSEDGVKLGAAAVDYCVSMHGRKLIQKRYVEENVVDPLEAEIDQRNLDKYQGNGTPKQIERKLGAVDKKIILLSEVVNADYESSDSDGDLDFRQKIFACKEASQRVLKNWKTEYKKAKAEMRGKT